MNDNRQICKKCNGRYRAIAYTRPSGKIQYRSLCEHCLKLKKTGKLSSVKMSWELKGYKKKATCDVCGFRSTLSSQIVVYHIDGNLNNAALSNLRSVCLCCVEVVKRKNFTWRIGDIQVDH